MVVTPVWWLNRFLPRPTQTVGVTAGISVRSGKGLSIAIGACFARPGERVTHVTADSAFVMNVADFYTAVAFKLPLTVIILNDQAVGQEKHDLMRKQIDPTMALTLLSRTLTD